MPDRVEFELVTPERLLLSEMVEMVVVPGTEGNFGVLPGHAPLISTIRPGMIEIYQGQTVTRRIFVVSGVAEVTPERCTVLADEAVSPDTLDRGSIETDLRTVEGNLPSLREQVARAADTDRERLLIELHRLEREQAVLHAKLQALDETNSLTERSALLRPRLTRAVPWRTVRRPGSRPVRGRRRCCRAVPPSRGLRGAHSHWCLPGAAAAGSSN